MSMRGAVLLAIGMLVLGLLLGIVSGGVTGFVVAQSIGPIFGQGLGSGQPQTVPFPRSQQNPNATPGSRGSRQLPSPNATPVPGQAFASGAVVTTVEQDSPAAKAGLQNGDIITAVDNAPIDENHALADLIGAHKPGDQVKLAVTRGSQNLTLNVTLGQSPQDSSMAYLGIRFAPLTVPFGNPRRQPGNNNNFPNG